MNNSLIGVDASIVVPLVVENKNNQRINDWREETTNDIDKHSN